MKSLIVLIVHFSCLMILSGCKDNPVQSNDNINYKIAFQFEGSLSLMNLNGMDLGKIHNLPAVLYDVNWSPDGMKIAYDAYGSVNIISLETSDQVLYEGGQGIHLPSWLDADNVITSDLTGSIFKINIITKIKKTITNGGRPQISPSGNKIAFMRNDALLLMNEDGSNIQHLSDSVMNRKPVWSPMRNQIAYIRNGALTITNHDGNDMVKLTEDFILSEADRRTFSWSPDGARLAYTHRLDSSNQFGLGVVNTDGSGNRIIIEENISLPLWRNFNGVDWIFYYSNTQNALMKVRPDGSEVTKIMSVHGQMTFDISPVALP